MQTEVREDGAQEALGIRGMTAGAARQRVNEKKRRRTKANMLTCLNVDVAMLAGAFVFLATPSSPGSGCLHHGGWGHHLML